MSQCPASTAHQQTKANNKPPPSSVGFSLRHRNSRPNRRCLANAPVRSLLHRTRQTKKELAQCRGRRCHPVTPASSQALLAPLYSEQTVRRSKANGPPLSKWRMHSCLRAFAIPQSEEANERRSRTEPRAKLPFRNAGVPPALLRVAFGRPLSIRSVALLK
jgi:hypothetical protein